jgi:hypothetical protein
MKNLSSGVLGIGTKYNNEILRLRAVKQDNTEAQEHEILETKERLETRPHPRILPTFWCRCQARRIRVSEGGYVAAVTCKLRALIALSFKLLKRS